MENNKIFSKRGDLNEYGYSTKFSATTFPFTLKTLVCSLLTALQYTEDDSDKLTKLKIFKSILYSFSRTINHEEPNKGKGLADKRPFIPKPFIAKVEKQFKNVIELEFFNENLLIKYLELVNPNALKEGKNSKSFSKASAKSDDPLGNVLGELQKKLDRVFKINERKFEDNWNESAEELIAYLSKNFGFQNYKNIPQEESSEEESEDSGQYGIYGKMQDDSEEEEEEEEAEEKKDAPTGTDTEAKVNEVSEDDTGMFDFEKQDLVWRVDQQLFEPLREIFGFRDTREED